MGARPTTSRRTFTMRTIDPTPSERGQAMVEFALVLPIFAVLIFAIAQLGVVFMHYLALTDAVRAGARQGAVARLKPNPVGATESAVRAAGVNLDQSQLQVAVSTPAGWTRGNALTVSATYPYEVDVLGWAVKAGQLESRTTERIE